MEEKRLPTDLQQLESEVSELKEITDDSQIFPENVSTTPCEWITRESLQKLVNNIRRLEVDRDIGEEYYSGALAVCKSEEEKKFIITESRKFRQAAKDMINALMRKLNLELDKARVIGRYA